MSTEKEKYISETLLKEKPQKPPLKFRLGPKWVNKIEDLQNQIDSMMETGVAVSNEFGDNPHIAISQKTLTEAFGKLWDKLEEITGESLNGISMTVTPQYYIGNSCLVLISANTIRTYGIFEHIRFYWNFDETPFLEYSNVQGVSDIVELPVERLINSKIIIRCEAQIMGRIYSEQKEITHYESFFLGAGATYQDLMINGNFDPAYSKPVARHMRAAYDVNVGAGDHIIIVLGEHLVERFIRADINGIEIEFIESTVRVPDVEDGNVYKVLTSVNTYQAGVINVDING